MADTDSSHSVSSHGHSTSGMPTSDHRETSLLERQDSVEEFMDSSDLLPSERPLASQSLPPPLSKAKKEKISFGGMFKRSKKKKLNKHQTDTDLAGLSIGSAESQHSFTRLRTARTFSGVSHLSPPVPARRRARSRPQLMGSRSDLEDLGDSDSELVASLVNPSPEASRTSSPSWDQQLEPRLSGVESDSRATPEPRVYQVQLTLHSGHNLAIRDRTGSSDPYVKFKCGKYKYRSAVVHRNLNPEWNESFSFKTSDLKQPLIARVFDHDFGSLDDYMGGQVIYLNNYVKSEMHILDLGLESALAASRGENLGSIRLFLQIYPEESHDGGDPPRSESPRPARARKSSQVWTSVVTVALLSASNLPAMDDNGFSDPYCKLKLGSQKYKSRVITKSLDPKWMEYLSLRLYDDTSTSLHIEVWDKDFPQSDDFIGSCSLELGSLSKEVTHTVTLPLAVEDDDDRGTISLMVTITGTAGTDSQGPLQDMPEVARRYSLLRTVNLKERRDVGTLRVRVDRAEDLPCLESYVVVVLGNSPRLTHTVYRTANPVFDKTFEIKIEDIHDELMVMVIRGEKRIGMAKIPLHRIRCEEPIPLVLKNKNLTERAKGVVYIECELVYNPVRAAIRTINPKAEKISDVEEKFSRKILMNNITRVTQVIRNIMALVEFVKSFWTWEDKFKSAVAFIVFVLFCVFGELWMFLIVASLAFVFCYMDVYIRGKHVWQLRRHSSHRGIPGSTDDANLEGFSDFSDLEEELKTSKGQTNLRSKFKQLQEILLIVQKVLGQIADMEERARNLFNWSVPFLCWMAIVLLSGAALLIYFVPLRYVILVWGINKFSKRLRNPNHIGNNELLDYMSRSPTNKQLEQWRQLAIHSTPKAKKNKKQRSADKKRR